MSRYYVARLVAGRVVLLAGIEAEDIVAAALVAWRVFPGAGIAPERALRRREQHERAEVTE